MGIYEVILLIALFASTIASYPRISKQYRTDYEYNRITNAFYKFHIESVRGWDISRICEAEGAEPLVISSEEDMVQGHGMFKQYPDLGGYVWVGIDGLNHESAEENSIINLESSNENDYPGRRCDVMTRTGAVESYPCYHELPFLCKVNADNAPYDSQCDVYGKDYQFYPSVNSCYKIPRISYNWNQAYAECQAEGAHLVVINSETEAQIVQNLTKTTPSVTGSKYSWFFFAGFRAERTEPRVFRTIMNQTLEEAGFAQWSEHEPNNSQGKEYCGSIFKNDGKLNDLDCTHIYGFICEKEVHT